MPLLPGRVQIQTPKFRYNLTGISYTCFVVWDVPWSRLRLHHISKQGDVFLERRDFLKGLAAGAGALAGGLAGCSGSGGGTTGGGQVPLPTPTPTASPSSSPQSSGPNILYLMVDELRFPQHFPPGVNSADEFIAKFMPNLFKYVWQSGVVFTSHRTSASACTPSRAVLATGLYNQQNWILQTVNGASSGTPPTSLQPEFPTFGKGLRAVGYQTPYFGKFHITSTGPYNENLCSTAGNFLEPYGFTAMTCPDLVGDAGTGDSCGGSCYGDAQIADAAVAWFSQLTPGSPKFAATVSFVNPHDREYFWAGTEAFTYMPLFAAAGKTPLRSYNTAFTGEANPPANGFAPVPSNWETFEQLRQTKPKSQLVWNEAHQCGFGAPSFDQNFNNFQVVPSLAAFGNISKALAPFQYWQKGQDSYIQVIQMVDAQIGNVFASIPQNVLDTMVVVFTADHGEYAGSHGFTAGKEGTAYEEILHIPLVVRDYTGRFARAVNVPRTQITSSVDINRLLVTLGNNGSSAWLTGDYAQLYSTRLDILRIVQDPTAPGRPYHLFTTDERVADIMNFNDAPLNVACMVTRAFKIVVYSYWKVSTTQVESSGRLLEFYDYATEGGRSEVVSTPDDPRATTFANLLMNDLLPNEIRQPLPEAYRPAQIRAEAAWIAYRDGLYKLNLSDIQGPGRFQPGLGG